MQGPAHVLYVQGTCSVNPPPEHDLRTRIRYQCRRKVKRSRTRRIVRQLYIIRHHDVGQHRFQHARSKETSRAILQSVKACS